MQWLKQVQQQRGAEVGESSVDEGADKTTSASAPCEVNPGVSETSAECNDKMCQADFTPETKVKCTQTLHTDCEKCVRRKQKIRALQKQNWRLKEQREKWKEAATQVSIKP